MDSYIINFAVIIIAVVSDDDSHNDEDLYSYVYENHQRNLKAEDEDMYYTTGDEILELRRNIKPRANRSIKGSKSLENLRVWKS